MRPLGEVSGGGAGLDPTSPAEVDRLIERLGQGAPDLLRASPAEKAELLGEVMHRLVEMSRALTEAGCRAKGIAPDEELVGEELLAGPVATLRYLRLLRQSLTEIAEHGLPNVPDGNVREHPVGSAVTALPISALDKVRFAGISAEVWQEVSPSEVHQARAALYRDRERQAAVSLVLGAGNIAAIPACDSLHQLFVQGRTCLLKMSPVNEYLGPLYETVFAPLVKRGWLAFTYGGPDVGSYCTQHPGIASVHITGSGQTHDRIVWGDEPEQSARKQRGEPILKKQITSELGNITPVIVPPAEYTARERDHLARSIAGMLAHNASFNCLTARMLILPETAQGRDILARVGSVLASTPTRKAYYPGAKDRYERLVRSADQMRELGRSDGDRLPWALVTLDPASDSPLLHTESFCSILAVTLLPERDPLAFLAAATRFANDELWGTLSATVIAPKSLLGDASTASAVESAVDELNYGSVCLNAWSGLAFGVSEMPWGAAPGATLADAKSGIGWAAHNALMFERVKKCVVRAPLAAFPTPFWYPGHRSLRKFASAFLDYEFAPSPLKLAKLAGAAVPG